MSNTEKTVLIVDDSLDDLEACARNLLQSNYFDYTVLTELSPQNVLTRLKGVDCAVIDYQLPATTGLDLLLEIKAVHPMLPIVIMTGHAEEATAVKLLKAGAVNYINKTDLASNEFDKVVATAISNSIIHASQQYSLATNINVLVLDDNEDDLELCERLLNKRGGNFTVHTNTSSTYLTEQLIEFEIDCLLLDYSMPGKSGLDILKEVATTMPHIAVIVMTGQGNEKIAVDAIKSGAENYLVKSHFDAHTLHSNIVQAVDKKQLEKQLRQKERELIESKAALLDRNNFLNLILETMPGPVFVKDTQYRIVEANSTFLSLYPPEMRDKIIGTTTLESYSDDAVEEFLIMDKRAFDEGYSENLETADFPNGERRTLFTTKTKFTNSNQQEFILGVSSDVTEREILIQQLKKSNADLEDFAYVASHDLKSPLNAIGKLIAWIDEDYAAQMPDKANELFALIQGRVQRMSKLLEDLLEYSRVQRALADDNLINVTELEGEIRSLTSTSRELNLRFKGDAIALPKTAFKMIMLNLTNNAIKHHDSPIANVIVNVNESDTAYHISVSDDGPGIPPQYSEKVFQMFQTLQPRDTVEGSGMGLALVKKVLDFYNGSIELEQKSGRGATFTIQWPKNSKLSPRYER